MPLSRVMLTCLARRGWGAARRSPLAALSAVVLAVGLPPLLYRASVVVAAELGPALGDLDVARAALAGAALPCVAAGLALSAAAVNHCPSGHEIACAPVAEVDRAVATLVVPVVTLGLVAAPTALAVSLPLAQASPGGMAAAPVVLLALAGVVVCAGACAAAVRAAWSKDGRVARGGLALVASGLATGVVSPLEPAARTLAGTAGVGWSLVLSGSTVAMGLAAWALLGGRAGSPYEGRGRSLLFSPRPAQAVLQAALAMLVRRRDMRSAALGALVIAIAGLVVARLEQAPPPLGALLAAAGALVALAPLGLAVGGATRDGRALWRTSPRPAAEVAAGWALASLVVTAGALACVTALALGVRALPPGDVGRVTALCLGGWACALAAGALVPWQRAGVAEQAVSLGVFGLVAAGASFVAGWVGPAASDLGVPPSIVAGALVTFLLGGSFGALWGHVARSS